MTQSSMLDGMWRMSQIAVDRVDPGESAWNEESRAVTRSRPNCVVYQLSPISNTCP